MKLVFGNLEEIIASIFIIITTILVVVNVFLRYVMKTGLTWSEEVATSCFVWSVFIGAAACYKRRGHVGVDIVVNKLARGPRNVVKILVDFILLVLTGYMAYVSIVYVSLSYTKPTPVLNVSTAYISSALMISFILMFLYTIVFIVKDFQNLKKYGNVDGDVSGSITGKEEQA